MDLEWKQLFENSSSKVTVNVSPPKYILNLTVSSYKGIYRMALAKNILYCCEILSKCGSESQSQSLCTEPAT